MNIFIIIGGIILLGTIAFLCFKKRLCHLQTLKWKLFLKSFRKLERWIIGSLLGMALFNLVLGLGLDVIKGVILPDPNKEVVTELKDVKKDQDKFARSSEERDEEIIKLLNEAEIDARDIGEYLNRLPIEKGKSETKEVIDEWYIKRNISSKVKDLLYVIVVKLFEHTDALKAEIEYLRSIGNLDFAEILENIQRNIKLRNAERIRDGYFEIKDKLDQQKITVLKQSIEGTKAIFAIDETKELYQELVLVEPSMENHMNYAIFLQTFEFLQEALEEYGLILKECNELAATKKSDYLPFRVKALNNTGVIQKELNNVNEAKESFQKSIRILKKMVAENKREYLLLLSAAYNNLAGLYHKVNEHSIALANYKEAIKILQEGVKENRQRYLPILATAFNNIASVQQDINDRIEALENYEKALRIRRELSEKNPNRYLPVLAITLSNTGGLLKEMGEYQGALSKYKESVLITRKLIGESSGVYLPSLAIALSNLSVLYGSINEKEKAKETYKESLQIFRELARENPDVYLPYVAKTLNNSNFLLAPIGRGEIQYILGNYEESLGIYRDFAVKNPGEYLPYVARTLHHMATLQKFNKEDSKAIESYNESLSIYKKLIKDKPLLYEFDYCTVLLQGVRMFGMDKTCLVEVNRIVKKYPSNPRANKLLLIVQELEKNDNV